MLRINLENDAAKDSSSVNDKKKKKSLVKHRRKNWAKTDLTEIEKGIDELRQQERTGGVVAEKKDEELFFINKKKLNLNEDGTEIELIKPKKTKLTLQEKLNNLGCYKNLRPDPNSAPAHIVHSRQVPDKTSKRQLILTEKETKKLIKILKSTKKSKKNSKEIEEEANKENDSSSSSQDENSNNENKTERKEKKPDVVLIAEFEKDLWTSSDLPEINDTNEYFLKTTKKILPKRPKNPLYRASALPKVETPHPGTSYNPDYDEHQDLLLKAHLIELRNLNEEQKLLRKLSKFGKKVSWDELERLWLDEMSVKEIFESDHDDEESKAKHEQEENEKKNEMSISKKELKRRLEAKNFGKSNDSKAKRQRKKLMEKLKQKQKENEKKIRIQQNEIYRIRSIKKQVEEKLKKEEENKLQREVEKKNREQFGVKRLGPYKYEEPELELKLSDEITGNLRSLKPEGNIMTDRYKSLQKRNLIEPRQKAKTFRKYSKKKFEKRNAFEKTHFIR